MAASPNIYRHFNSPMPLRKVNKIQFSILSPEEIKAMSVAKIEQPEFFDADNNPKEGGLLDRRLGVYNRNFICVTCGGNMNDCPGHFGHIDLAKPVFNYGFLSSVKKILECVCFYCGKLRVDRNDYRMRQACMIKENKRRFIEIWNICSSRMVCVNSVTETEDDSNKDEDEKMNAEKYENVGCGQRQPLIKKDGALELSIYVRNQRDDSKSGDINNEPKSFTLTPEKARRVLKLVSDEDCILMGFNPEWARPEWMILTVLPVPPMSVRPSVSMDGITMNQDDLTHKLRDILLANYQLRKHESEDFPNHVIQDFEKLLQYHVSTYMDNEISGVPTARQKSGRLLKSISARLKGKEGRLRGNLMGKRVDFSARTVITGDPNISIDQIGVPLSIAKNLTFPETVTVYNINEMRKCVRNGPNEYPGAKYIIKDTGERINLKYSRRGGNIYLRLGYKVERHLVDGDVVIFNRQPSLHKMSMMGHKIKVMPYSTFRLNLSVAGPYNADFDGDEMNLHVPQSYGSRAEVEELCLVPKQIISSQNNAPVMGIVQDTLCGICILTKRDTFVEKSLLMNLLLFIPNWDGIMPQPAIIKPIPLWTGKQLVTLLIPSRVNITCYNTAYDEQNDKDNGSSFDTRVIIEDGELLAGILCKKTVGTSAGGIIHVIVNEHGPNAARMFFNGTQLLVNHWFIQYGFSIGIGDTIVDRETSASVINAINEARNGVKKIIEDAHMEKLQCLPGMTVKETFESRVSKELNKARDVAGKNTQRSLKEFNNVKQMVVSGSKGSYINISQMTGCVGQQTVEGKRIPFGFRQRTLPHFTKDDHSPLSRGFVENSYLRGLTPQEFFFHAMGGREGLIDTAVKTAETGYIQRRLVKALEDLMVHYDGTVRNSMGEIIQFCYGEDGMDGAKMERQNLDIMNISDEAFRQKYKIDLTGGKYGLKPGLLDFKISEKLVCSDVQALFDEEFETLLKDRETIRNEIFPHTVIDFWPLPMNIKRLIKNASQENNVDPDKPLEISPMYIVTSVKKLLDELTVIRGNDILSVEDQKNATMLFKILLRSMLASRRIIEEFRLNTSAFDWLLGEISRRFSQCIVNPGEMVGTLAAQSIGEPATQITLNTFHLAGVGSIMTLGVPRLKEIINVTKDIKTPSLKVYLTPEYSVSQDKAKMVQVRLEHTTLMKLMEETEIAYDPDPLNSEKEADREIMIAYAEMEENDDLTRYSPWVLRIKINFNSKMDKGITLEEIATIIMDEFQGDVRCWHSDENADELLLLVRVVTEVNEKEDGDMRLEEDVLLKRIEKNMLNEITLAGVPQINKVYINSMQVPSRQEDGSLKIGDEPEYFLETDGTALSAALALEGVDATRSCSNSSIEVYNVLGIEAARAIIMKEIRNVIEFDGTYVNYRHLALLCDIMTQRGGLMAITRHGINRTGAGVLARSSFEETVELLIEAASFGELDDCKGISESIILGQLARAGTGQIDIILDENMLINANFMEFSGNIDGTPEAGVSFANQPIYSGSAHMPYAEKIQPKSGYSPAGPVAFSPYGPITGKIPSGDGYSFGNSGYSPTSHGPDHALGYSTASPSYSPAIHSRANIGYSPASPSYSLASPSYSPASPSYSPAIHSRTALGYSPASPSYSPASPSYSPASPSYSPASPSYSPASPSYSPASPSYSPASPSYSPASPSYSPASPSYSPASPSYSPASPSYSPASPSYSPASPSYSPASPSYSPASPSYSPASPSYSPASPSYSPASTSYSPASPSYSPNMKNFSSTSHAYPQKFLGYPSTLRGYYQGQNSYNQSQTGYSPTSSSYKPPQQQKYPKSSRDTSEYSPSSSTKFPDEFNNKDSKDNSE